MNFSNQASEPDCNGKYIILRKLGLRDGDLSQRRYFYVGQRHGVCIYEAYNLFTGVRETDLHQRLIWQESQDEFVAARQYHRRMIEECLD